MTQPKKITALLLLLALHSRHSTGQDTDTLTRELQPVEVRGLRAGSLAPFAKSEISGKALQEQNLGQDIPYLLQYTPGAVATSDAGAGIGYTGLRIRGTDGTRINVTLNGIPVNDGESHGTFFVNIPDLASSTGSVQLQRGVGTSTNGGGAFGATMSISTLNQMSEAGVAVHNTYGSFNTWKNTVQAGTGLLKNGLRFDVRLSRLVSDGFRERSTSDMKSMQFIAGWQMADKTSLRFMMMAGDQRTGQAWNGVHQAQLENNQTEKERHYSHNVGVMYFTPQDSVNFFHADPRRNNYFTYKNQTDNYRQQYYQLFFDHGFNAHLTLHLAGFLTRGKGYYEEYKPVEKYSSYDLPDYITPSLADTFRHTDLIRQLWLDNYFYGSVFSLMYQKAETQLSLGGSLTRYTGDHYGFIKWAQYNVPADYRWYMLPAQKNDANIYLKAQTTIAHDLILFGDLQYRQVQHRIAGFRKNPGLEVNAAYHFFNPKAGITWLIRHTGEELQKAYASVAVANREPNRDDFEASPLDLPKPEQLYDVEAGYEFRSRSWSAAANLYYMHYHNQLIVTGRINDVGAYTRTNVPESYRTGVELEAAVRPAGWVRAQANFSLSQHKIRDFISYTDNWDSGDQDVVSHGTTDIAFSPNTVAGASVTLIPFRQTGKWNQLEFELLQKYVGRQFLDNTSNENRVINAYYVTDLHVRYRLAVRPFREAALTLGINNLFNRQYVSNGYTYAYHYSGTTYTDNYYYPQAGINWLLALSLKW